MVEVGQRSENQAEQQRLVEEAMALPGVAEVIELYGAFQPYASIKIAMPGAATVYASGGNL